MAEQVQLFTREELKSRNTREDAILIIHNCVYDVTKFLDEEYSLRAVPVEFRMAEQVQLFTREELKSRNTREDAILIIHNCVYNVTKFLDEHPGGEEVLLEMAGQEATEPFEDVSHSSDARSLMKKYKIGELVEADRSTSKSYAAQWNNDTPQEQGNATWASWVTPLLLALAATLLYRYLFV